MACAVCSGSFAGADGGCVAGFGAAACCTGVARGAGLDAGFAVALGAGAGFSSSPTKKLFILPKMPLSEAAYDVRDGVGAGFESAAAVMKLEPPVAAGAGFAATAVPVVSGCVSSGGFT